MTAGPGGPPAALPGQRPPALFTRPFVSVLLIALLGFCLEAVLRTVIPLMVLDRGGNALWVGVTAAAAALPSVLFRPWIGGLIDTWRHDIVLRAGAAALAVGSVFVLLPGLVSLAIVRFLHGTGWATYSVANHALMAKLAPVHRRGEASGYFMAMPALATLVGPAAGVTLYVRGGDVPPLVLAAGLGTAAFLVSLVLRIPSSTGTGRSAAAASGLVERSAVPSTVMVTTFMAAHSLFLVFPPVYVAAVGAPLEFLALYYPVYGLVMTVSQLLIGRASDRLGRSTSIRMGCGIAIGGLTAAVVLHGTAALVVASAAYAVAISLVSPTLSALTIDRAPSDRIGAAMATYSLGYQLATGASSLMWGAVIAVAGFPWPFALAIALQVITLAMTFRFVPRRTGRKG